MRSLTLLVLMALSIAVSAPTVRAAGPQDDVNSLGLTATYAVDATFDWSERSASVQTHVSLTNATRWPVSTVAFNLGTLRTGQAEIRALTVDGVPVAPRLIDQTILVPLARPLAPRETASAYINYRASLNASSSINGDAWEFARIDEVLTAYRWIPWLSRTTPFDRPNVGDPFVTATSPHVSVHISMNQGVRWATSGVQELGGTEHTNVFFEADNVRDFNLAASTEYRTSSMTVDGTTVTLFYRNLDPDVVLQTAARAMRDYTNRIGPYPHAQLTIAEVGPWSPFESPAHFWLPENAPARLLPWMVAHEVAHQWFYSAVGNDQAREPFADEALADYFARSLLRRYVRSQCPTDRLDQTIYEIRACYPWVVYVQGVAWLRAMRTRMGAAAFTDALRNYFDEHRGGLGGTRALLDALSRAGGARPTDYARFPTMYPAALVTMPIGRAVL